MFKSGVGNQRGLRRSLSSKRMSKLGAVFLLVALMLAGLPVGSVHAAVCTWSGSTSTDWGDALNWSGCGGVAPQAADTAVIPDVTNDPVLSGDVTIAGLTIQSGGFLSVGANTLTLNGSVTNSGMLSGDTGTVVLAFSGQKSLSGSGLYDLNHLIVSSSGGTVNLFSNVTVHVGGNFTKSAGSFKCASANDATSNTCTLDFDGGGTSLFSWTNASILPWNITVQSGATVTIGATNNSFTLRGDLGGEGTLTASGGTITFETVTTANLAGTKTLNNLIVNSPTQLLLATNANFGYKGAFTLNGTFDAITNPPTTLILAGTSAQALPSGVTALHNLTINNPSGATLGANVTVNGTLALGDNTLTTDSYTLALASATGITRASGFVIGNLQKSVTGPGTVVFEIGSGATYAPVSVTFNSVAGPGTLTASTTVGKHPNFDGAYPTGSGLDGANYINRYWTLTQSGLTNISYDATFNFVNPGDYFGLPTPTSMAVRKFDSPEWSKPTSSSATETYATGTGFISFSDFAVGNAAVVTPVTLSYFAATRVGSGVNLEWATAAEIGNLGFNLYADEGGELTRLNAELIPSKNPDSLAQQDYSFRAETRATVFYLEEVDLQGTGIRHGPFALGETFGGRVDENKIDWDAIQDERRLSPDLSAGPGPSSGLALKVRATGLYRVSYEMLRDAGLDLAGVPLSNVTLACAGRPVPIFVKGMGVFGPGAYLEFYGQALDTLYTDANVYLLQVNQPTTPRIQFDNSLPGRGAKPPLSYAETRVVNNQRAYSNSSPGAEPWYDTSMMVFKTPGSWEFFFEVDGLMPTAPATMEVVVWGMTSWLQAGDHHLRVSVNGIPLADQIFDGRAEKILRLSLPVGLLREGANTLRLTLPGDTGAPAEMIALDKFRVTYPRAFAARDGQLTFTATGKVFKVTGLPDKDIVVYRLDKDRPVRLGRVIVRAEGGAYAAVFAGTNMNSTYAVATVRSLFVPEFESARPFVDLNRAAQYLVIAHPDFIEGLSSLIRARQAQGLAVSVVDVNDVYAQYSYGVFDPSAIQKYIAYAVQNLGTQYVLLVGGDTYDYRNYLGVNSLSFIPSLYTRTGPLASFVPSDPLYADADRDNLPDAAIGRFPVRTAAELDILVAKTLAYDAKDYGRTAVFVSDRDSGRASFKDISLAMSSGLPGDWTVEGIHLNDMELSAAREQLLAAMNRGVALVAFTGHSGPQKWTSRNLFNSADAVSLTNVGRPFVAVQWGCYNNYYVDPLRNNLAQGFLLSGDRGAAATLGATTLADSGSEKLLGVLLLPRLAQPGMRIGDAVQLAKAELAQAHPGLSEMQLGWTIMGDPALVIEP